MRSAYGAQLAALTEQLAEMCRVAGIGMERSTEALLKADVVLAEQVIGDHEVIPSVSAEIEQSAIALLALQAPVGRDLHAIVSSIQIVADIERMCVLALHVAKAVRRRHPGYVIPAPINGYFAEMGRIAVDLEENARQVILTRDLGRARYIREADDAMDDIHRHLFTEIMDRDWTHGTTAAIDVTLLSRFYERFADHAVEISRRVIFQSTGQIPGETRCVITHRAPRMPGLSRTWPQ